MFKDLRPLFLQGPFYFKLFCMYEMSRILTLDEIPDGWIYSHFYNKGTGRTINQPFDGRSIKVKSFSSRDTNPSLCFYFSEGRYKWQDFSTGRGGDVVSFVMDILNKERTVATDIIKVAYSNFRDQGSTYTMDIKPQSDKKFNLYPERYNARALNFWEEWSIYINTLNHFNVKKLASYNIQYSNGSNPNFFGMLFGYYTKDMEPYQIYGPERIPKYITIRGDIIPGYDQLTYKHKILAIVSGLKDLMALHVLNLDLDIIANPTGEGTLIKSSIIEDLRKKYKHIVSIMDNDKAGIKSMIRYEKAYGVLPVWIKLSKDLAQNNKDYKSEFLRANYGFTINKCIYESEQKNLAAST